MAKYSDIKGFTVQTLSTDTVASQAAGGSWASGGSLNSARANLGSSGSGPQSATLAFGGSPYPRSLTALTELYNGSSWTEVNDLNTVRDFPGGAGVSTSAMALGGHVSVPTRDNIVELWDGSSWTETTDMNVAVAGRNAAGASNTAVLGFGGYTPGSEPPSLSEGQVAQTELWNGSTWTEVNDLNSARLDGGGSGTSTAAILSAGYKSSTSATVTDTEQWDGTSWTAVADVNTKRFRLGQGGTYTNQLIFGGSPYPPVASTATEAWNGTSWTEVNDLSTSRGELEGSGTSSADAIGFGGATSSTAVTAVTEEWTAPAVFNQITEGQLFFNSTTNTFKETIKDSAAGTWASGGTMNQARLYSLIYSVSGGPSGQSDAFAISGANPASTNLANVESYNGTAWTETTDVNTARRLGGGCGGQPAAVVAGGYTTGDVANTEVWNGSSWTETGDLNSAKRQFAGSFGTPDSSSDLLVSGAFPRTANVEIWDGSSWTETSNLNQSRSDGAGIGVSSTAGLVAGGQSSPSPIPGQTAYAENWNGSSWTEVAEFNTNRMNLAAAGEQTSGLLMGGNTDPDNSTTTEIWNGSSWTELNDLSTGVAANSGGGSSVAAISFGGSTPTITGASEEFTAALSNKTITAS